MTNLTSFLHGEDIIIRELCNTTIVLLWRNTTFATPKFVNVRNDVSFAHVFVHEIANGIYTRQTPYAIIVRIISFPRKVNIAESIIFV